MGMPNINAIWVIGSNTHLKLGEIALGLAYLHSEEIVHGDLRGVNEPSITSKRQTNSCDYRQISLSMMTLESVLPTSDCRYSRKAGVTMFRCVVVDVAI